MARHRHQSSCSLAYFLIIPSSISVYVTSEIKSYTFLNNPLTDKNQSLIALFGPKPANSMQFQHQSACFVPKRVVMCFLPRQKGGAGATREYKANNSLLCENNDVLFCADAY